MKKIILMTISVIILVSCATTPEPKIFPTSDQVECIENIKGNSYKYLAWGIGENNADATDDALRAAMYACLVSSGAGGCNAMLDTKEKNKAGDFLKQFFSDGSWSSFVVNTSDGRIDPGNRLRMEDGRIKIGIDVIIRTKDLREYLISKKIIEKSPYGL